MRGFVLTSSSSAVSWPNLNSVVNLDENTWNAGSVERAWDSSNNDDALVWDVYAASKVESEKLLWRLLVSRGRIFL